MGSSSAVVPADDWPSTSKSLRTFGRWRQLRFIFIEIIKLIGQKRKVMDPCHEARLTIEPLGPNWVFQFQNHYAINPDHPSNSMRERFTDLNEFEISVLYWVVSPLPPVIWSHNSPGKFCLALLEYISSQWVVFDRFLDASVRNASL